MTASYEAVSLRQNDHFILDDLAQDAISKSASPIMFGERLANSASFESLFDEGMRLIEWVSSYLDGEGREEAQYLSQDELVIYTSESMRLTTYLMQIAAWLFLRRAVNEGELTHQEAASHTHRIRLTTIESRYDKETLELLPLPLQTCLVRGKRLHTRITHLDKLLYQHEDVFTENARPHGLETQWGLLEEAFQ